MFSGCNCIDNVEFRCLNNVSDPIEIDNATNLFNNCRVRYVDFANLYFRVNTDYTICTNPTLGTSTVFSGKSNDYLYDYRGCYKGLEKVNFGEHYNYECTLRMLAVSYESCHRDTGITSDSRWTMKQLNEDMSFNVYNTMKDAIGCDNTPKTGFSGTYYLCYRHIELGCPCFAWFDDYSTSTSCKVYDENSKEVDSFN